MIAEIYFKISRKKRGGNRWMKQVWPNADNCKSWGGRYMGIVIFPIAMHVGEFSKEKDLETLA